MNFDHTKPKLHSEASQQLPIAQPFLSASAWKNLQRVALAACMLSSRKHQDNISKLVYKSDFDKVKGKDTTKKLDEILHTLWAEAQDQKHEKSLAFNAFGTACVRMVLHLLQKEKAAKQDTFESFQEIVQKFQDDLSGGGVPAPPAAPPVLATSSAGSSKGVQDLVNCSSKEIALVQNSHIKVGERPVCFKRMCGVCTLVCQWLCIEKKYKN